MPTQPKTCDPSLIERYLAESLDAASEAGLHSHLETCQTCRQQLQQSAAEPSSWGDAEEFLPDQPFDVVSLSTSSLRLQDEHDDTNHHKVSASVEVAQVLAMLNATDDPASQKPQLRIDYADLSGRPSGTRMISDLEDLAAWIPSSEECITFLVYESAQGGSFQ